MGDEYWFKEKAVCEDKTITSELNKPLVQRMTHRIIFIDYTYFLACKRRNFNVAYAPEGGNPLSQV